MINKLKFSIKRGYSLLKYKGKKYKCPICGYCANSFLPAGLYEKRLNSACPDCKSLVRHRHMWIFIKEMLEEQKNTPLKIIHFAPEKCLSSKLSNISNVEYFTSEYDKSKLSDFHFNLEKINHEGDYFNYIICSHVLEHVKDDLLALKELKRILKVGGKAYLQVPLWPSESHYTYENFNITDPRDRAITFGQYDHLRVYGLDIVERMEAAGFKVKIINIEENFSDEEIDYYRLHNSNDIRELIFECTK
tara:strand:- start:641 stop:1384 length:744 start_codon:yes stop_codon:yes gene_type:complete